MKMYVKVLLIVAAIVCAGAFFTYQAVAAGQADQATITTLSGQITDNGALMTDDGMEFVLQGQVADELKQMPGKRVEIMGTVMEEGGQKTIDVQDYRLQEDMPAVDE